ncbi:TlpA family protein disulfide reductase [Brevundimonas sp.]|uniref:TlpA family protein disulfide reductase n=1 Tax=Brevundimonas sp. TaxID=1871086 RepID=UPI003F6F8F64
MEATGHVSRKLGSPLAEGQRYRYDHPRLFPDVINDMVMGDDDLGPGDRLHQPALTLLDGIRIDSWRSADARPTLIIFGSRTCPVTISAAPGLVRLHESFGEHVRFVLVYVREAHPGGSIPQPRTIEQKQRHAAALKVELGLPFEVAVDDIDGGLHRKLGARPNSAYIVDADGVILFRAQWANVGEPLNRALAALAEGRAIQRPEATSTMTSQPGALRQLGSTHCLSGRLIGAFGDRSGLPNGASNVLTCQAPRTT